MAQFHHVIYFDTADELWHVDTATDAYLPDGEVWDYAGSQEWESVPDAEQSAYMDQMGYIQKALNNFKW